MRQKSCTNYAQIHLVHNSFRPVLHDHSLVILNSIDRATNCTMLIKNNGNLGPPISGPWNSSCVNRGNARNMVDTIFWNRRKVEKYNNPMVNLDLT